MMLFGRETAGLPQEVLALGETVRLPMRKEYRSFNLSNSVAVAMFEYLRQWDFPGLI
jgi:tRNA (cytidine/uridine-2'-O-)-methyltransferase